RPAGSLAEPGEPGFGTGCPGCSAAFRIPRGRHLSGGFQADPAGDQPGASLEKIPPGARSIPLRPGCAEAGSRPVGSAVRTFCLIKALVQVDLSLTET